MLTLYYNPISPNARRAWLTLLEKNVPFESAIVKLDGDQLQPEFLAINPFHHIPVLVDGDLRIVESLAIMDYLEAKYPTPAMLPTHPQDLAIVRMTQLVISNELFPKVIALLIRDEDSPERQTAKEPIHPVLNFLVDLLGDRPFFGSRQITLADVVAGTALPMLPKLNFSLAPFPTLEAWHDRLMQRDVWQKTQISPDDFELFKRRVKVLVKLRQREMIRSR